MGSEAEHVNAANRTHKTIEVLLSHKDVTSPWIATAAFYKALQIVEAAFSNDPNIRHTTDHDSRKDVLKHVRRYEHIAEHYFPLQRASQNARYLSNCKVFDDYMVPQQVIDELLKHRLHQVEKSAAKILGNPAALLRAESLVTTSTTI